MRSRAPASRPLAGFVVGGIASVAIGLALSPFDTLPDAVPALTLVLPVLTIAIVAGRRAAIGVAGVAAAAFGFDFIDPERSFLIGTLEGFLALAVFAAVALVVGSLVGREAARRRDAEDQRDEIEQMHEQFKTLTVERERLAEEARRVEVLEEIDRQRGALLRSVSHDLRSPLATIRGVSTDLRDRDRLDDDARRELLDLVVSESERLDRIVANLLSLSRIEAGAFEPDREPVDVEEMIVRSVARVERMFDRGCLGVELAPDLPFADADATQIDQVIANLLENAARHAPAGTATTVRAIAEPASIRITVEDAGPGMPAAAREHVLGHDAAAGRGAASGIGLTICRAIVEAHGGALCIDDRAGGGVRVSFTIPRAERPAPANAD